MRHVLPLPVVLGVFFCHGAATTEFYTLSLHDALPISARGGRSGGRARDASRRPCPPAPWDEAAQGADRKSTRLNSSHVSISYAVFCLKKKNMTCVDTSVVASFVAAVLAALDTALRPVV